MVSRRASRLIRRDRNTRNATLSDVSPITIAAIKDLAGETPVSAAIHAQLQSRATKMTKGGKPYLDIVFADSTGNFTL